MMQFPELVSSVATEVQKLAVSEDYQTSETAVVGQWTRDDSRVIADLTPLGPTGIHLSLKRRNELVGERTFAMHAQSVRTIARAIVEHLEGYAARV